MPNIAILNQETIDKIAAGEVVERPCSVVKELVENAIDAGSTAITVEIKEGGISFIRITDNGCGIERDQVAVAFYRHSTSKIRSAEDLLTVKSLGFRGEALSSISAVARVELITKTYDELTGTRYVIEGSKELSNEEIGAPDGTTFIVKDLFYNVPARRKFLKTAQTEGSYISDMVEKLALSHPDISFKFINNNQTKLHTSGNGNRKDIIYHIFGREISSSLLEVKHECEYFKVEGFIGKPVITRGNRNYENYFINGRYVKSNILSRAIEEAYKSFLMQHQYPFTVLYFTFFSELDVNVHPTKMELRFDNNNEIYVELCDIIYAILSRKEMIPEVPVDSTPAPKKIVHEYKEPIPEPFEKRRINEVRAAESRSVYGQSVTSAVKDYSAIEPAVKTPKTSTAYEPAQVVTGTQQTLGDYDKVFLTESAKKQFSIIGQLFKTYWLIEFEDKLYIIDQHAAHEKVLYEKTMARLANKDFTSQRISPPIVMTLDARECEMLEKYRPQIEQFGYEVEHFGGKEYMISAIPDNLFNIDMKDLFIEMLDDFSNATGRQTPDIITEKVASMSCKAAVKGNDKLTLPEINKLIDELLSLDNPYNCPHGRPTIISMSKYEIEKKFKRIV
ncbi:DNA mismatch repair endonuclease MutL [Agathobacter rectalis]|uniref:DNA mismatch repair protein MutL n=1 Tax=Agathobacter rectalis TaxID=39491 RepID=A0AAX0BEZ6_9FIRM|nr:DNA mismatch repair endonuclease MutL [Agathobacter rectalis]NSC26972.1 DNA mismatch repair endonuclease MutL [Agathobacter rectalis]NSC37006.1 DNA mismatch repair endonuclease MutL [Agathobacter rectalis]NSC52721.1 DNA mismatch repair endonuclease MutL [Agathobacter rectalis]NSC58596.1 DNA mismatch repair endonuclease MutL [Agathobacter rectalis]NSC64416.1 DNA mismatch repair endonuclease MutL [Agathobacter rectalis]